VMSELVTTTVAGFSEAYPELAENKAFVLQVAASEEEHFGATYRQGRNLLEEGVRKARGAGSRVLSGDVAFRLHDTFGFQEQLTIELAADEGLAVDTERFAGLMEEQRARARQAVKRSDLTEGPLADIAQTNGPTEFLGYERLEAEARVVGLIADGEARGVVPEGTKARLVMNRTPFYAEGGGQIGDTGTIRTPTGTVRVTDTRPGPGGTIVHEG